MNELKHNKHISILILVVIAIGVLALFSDYLCQSVTAIWEWLGKSGNSGTETNSSETNSMETNSATLRNLALAIFGLVGLGLAAWRSIIASQNTDIADRNSLIAEDNSITDAFTRAIEQLGSGSDDKPNIEVRLGAIYALERLSQNNGDYYQTIIDILASYVRHNAPIPPESERSPADRTRIDIQTAMTVLGRRRVRPNEPHLNLFRVYLPSIDLVEAKLQSAILIGAVFQKSSLNGAKFQGALLMNAKLQGASLSFAELQGANLKGAELQSADLSRAELQCARLTGANLQGARLKGTDLRDADLEEAKGLNCEQLKKAKNWQAAYRDTELSCDAEIPEIPFELDINKF